MDALLENIFAEAKRRLETFGELRPFCRVASQAGQIVNFEAGRWFNSSKAQDYFDHCLRESIDSHLTASEVSVVGFAVAAFIETGNGILTGNVGCHIESEKDGCLLHIFSFESKMRKRYLLFGPEYRSVSWLDVQHQKSTPIYFNGRAT